MQRVKRAVPRFSNLIRPISSLMEKGYKILGRLTKRAAAGNQFSNLAKRPVEEFAFLSCKRALNNQVALVHRDPFMCLCLYTDASNVV